MQHVELKEGHEYSSKPVDLWLSPRIYKHVAEQLIKGVHKLSHLLDIKIVDKTVPGKQNVLSYLRLYGFYVTTKPL